MAARKILWINPVGYSDYDRPMGEFMKAVKLPGTTVDVVSLTPNNLPPHLEYRTYEALIIADVVKLARHAAVNDYDAAVIGCFYDPGIEAAREISGNTTVVGPCQASLQIAANLANRVSIIIGQDKWAGEMHERVNAYGYSSYLASMRSIDIRVPDLQKDTSVTANAIVEAGRRAVQEDKAEALILGCTCSFGLYERVQDELGVPVIDPILAAFKVAEHLGGLRRQFSWGPSRAWTSAPPAEAELDAFGIFDAAPPIGNRLTF